MSGIIGGAGSKSGVIGVTELDYEEGDPNLSYNAAGGFSGSATVNYEKYIKIGSYVFINFGITFASASGIVVVGDYFAVGNYPFTRDGPAGGYLGSGYLNSSLSNNARLTGRNSGETWQVNQVNGNGGGRSGTLFGNIWYVTTS